ncbi:type II toxin-antitoxin system Phd/YefM family antitoxin [Pseudomonas sp. NA-150]
MHKTVSCTQARRRLRRLIALAALGHAFVITKHGKAVCWLLSAETDQKHQ